MPANYGSDPDSDNLWDHYFVIRCDVCDEHSIRFTPFEMTRFGAHELPRTKRKHKRTTCSARKFTYFEVCTTARALSYALMERLVTPKGEFPMLKFYASPSDPEARPGAFPLAQWGRPLDKLL